MAVIVINRVFKRFQALIIQEMANSLPGYMWLDVPFQATPGGPYQTYFSKSAVSF